MSEVERLEKVSIRYQIARDFDAKVNRYGATLILKKIKGKKALEFGAGDGTMTSVFLTKKLNLSLVEPTSGYVRILRKKFSSKVHIHQILIEDFEDNERYDEIIAAHLLEHVASPKNVLHKTRELLKDSGQLHVIVPNAGSLHRRIGVHMRILPSLTHFSRRDRMLKHRRVYTLETIRKEVQSAGFKIIHQEGIFLKPLSNAQMIRWDPKIISALFAVAKEVPIDLCAELYLICQKKK